MPVSYPDQLIITKTPGLLQFPDTVLYLERLRADIPGIKLLFIVKNPIHRAVGDIVHEYTQGAHRSIHGLKLNNSWSHGEKGLIQVNCAKQMDTESVIRPIL